MTDKLRMNDYITLSQTVGARKDYVQGGGGNTSVKLDGGRMAVKASGFRLNQISMDEAYVVVDAKAIRDWYQAVDLQEDRDFEKESTQAAKAAVVAGIGPQGLRPSVEAGFHAVLGNYVIHTHAVAANLLCCSEEGEGLVKRLFTEAGFPALWIPYINPGFCLTVQIRDKRADMVSQSGNDPHIIFMQNHGIIVWADNAADAVELHREVNQRILDYFQKTIPFPEPLLGKTEDGFKSATTMNQAFVQQYQADSTFFEKVALYPDQLVYLNSSMAGEAATAKVQMNPKTGEVLYRAGESEAMAMEETLLGYVWVIENLETLGLTRRTMTETDVDFIRNWESEAYRRKLVQAQQKPVT